MDRRRPSPPRSPAGRRPPALAFVASLALVVALAAGGAVAASAPGSPEPSEPAGGGAVITLRLYRQGEEVVRRALAALGGEAALNAAGGVSLEGTGTVDLATRLQGMHPERPQPVAAEERLAVDLAGGRVAYESHARVNPDADEWIRYVYDDQGRTLISLLLEGRAFWVPGDAEQRRRVARAVPHLLLRDVLAERRALRDLGLVAGRRAVAAALPGGAPLTLFFDPASHLLTGFEYLLDLPISGDTAVRWEYDEHRPVEGLGPYPSGYRIFVGDDLYKAVRYGTVRAGVAGAAVLAPPPGVEVPEPPAPAGPAAEPPAPPPGPAPEPSPPAVRTVAEGVHLVPNVRGGFHALFVEMADFVVVVDAPAGYHELQMVPAIDWAGDVTSSSVGRRLLAAVRATVPGKPVRYVVLTHHHGDHAGGVRPFLAAGATVLAAEPTPSVVARAAGAAYTLAPDELTGRAVAPRVEVVRGERTISDGERTVRVLDVGPNPHAEGMLVVYLPEEGLLYQSDLFMPSSQHFPDPARLPVMRWFVDWLDRSGLEPETIYSIHGAARVSEEQLERIRALGAGDAGAPSGR